MRDKEERFTADALAYQLTIMILIAGNSLNDVTHKTINNNYSNSNDF